MESLSFLPVTLASVLASFSNPSVPHEQAVISTHISPEIAGLWELDLQSIPKVAAVTPKFNGDIDNTELALPVTGGNSNITTENEQLKFKPQVLMVTQSRKIRSKGVSTQGTACRERYNFAADNEVLTTSGEEWTYGEYIYQHQNEGLPIIAISTIYDNNKTDCSGKRIDQTGDAMIAYVDYKPSKNEMRWCTDQLGNECFMTFRKLIP